MSSYMCRCRSSGAIEVRSGKKSGSDFYNLTMNIHDAGLTSRSCDKYRKTAET